MEIYFDNAATTRCSDKACEAVVQALLEDYGNAASLHRKGMQAEQRVRRAKQQIAKTLKAQEKELIFTSGGTEADNLAILGAASANCRQGRHLITTSIEHEAVLEPVRRLQEEGFDVTYLEVDENGLISLEQLSDAIRPDTILVSIMYVNNEIGAVEPVDQAARLIKERNPHTLFHVDAIQAYGKFILHPGRLGIDLMALSGHKIHGPKGVGALYVKERTKLRPLMLGGGHQRGMRSGTENVPGVAGFGVAAEEAYTDFARKQEHLRRLREAFLEGIKGDAWAHVNGSSGAPHIVNVSFEGVKSEVLLHALEDRGIYVSAGSACASNRPAVSHTLKGIGAKQAHIDSALRFSFSAENTLAEVAYALEALHDLVPTLMRFARH